MNQFILEFLIHEPRSPIVLLLDLFMRDAIDHTHNACAMREGSSIVRHRSILLPFFPHRCVHVRSLASVLSFVTITRTLSRARIFAESSR